MLVTRSYHYREQRFSSAHFDSDYAFSILFEWPRIITKHLDNCYSSCNFRDVLLLFSVIHLYVFQFRFDRSQFKFHCSAASTRNDYSHQVHRVRVACVFRHQPCYVKDSFRSAAKMQNIANALSGENSLASLSQLLLAFTYTIFFPEKETHSV